MTHVLSVKKNLTKYLSQVALLITMSVAAFSMAEASDSTSPVKIMREAEDAYFIEDSGRLAVLARQLESWSSSPRTIEAYAYAYTQFRVLQLAVINKDEKQAKQAGARCTESLDRLLKAQPTFFEGHALQSACYGYLANLGGFAAIRNGSRSGKAIDAALALAPSHPRIKLIEGFGIYFRPASVGGDKLQGCQKFSEAVEAFAAEATERRSVLDGYDWGAAEALFFTGRCARDAGDSSAAQDAFRKAAQLAPSFKRAVRAADR